jgi:16S rRNA (guanine(966)-N(2))-methyltransferase RsmD
VRIIRGIYRGKILHPPKSIQARPTTDFAKEGLFNILENQFDMGALSVLDLFAGTGSISLEFASRGCQNIQIIERDRVHVRFITKTVHELKFEGIEIHHNDVFKMIRNLHHRFNIIFADPPYDMKSLEELPDIIFEEGLLEPAGWFILEHSSHYDFSSHPAFHFHRQYGNVHFSFFN